MSEFTDNTRIISAENQEQLNEARDSEIEKVEKLEFLLNLLKNANLRQVELPDKEGIQKAINILSFQNYLQLDENFSLLNLNESKTVSLTYTERKAIRNYLIRKIPEACDPILNFADKIKEEIPEVYGMGDKNRQLIDSEMKRRNLQEKLAEIKAKKCAMLKTAADLKTGPYVKNELELMLADHRYNQMKTTVFQGYILNTLFSSKYTRTEHPVTIKAIKEVEAYIDSVLDAVE